MNIRNAFVNEAQKIKEIYENAKLFMRASGNMHQWGGDYPELSLILRDIESKSCYICEENGEILGVFCLFKGPDRTYNKIYKMRFYVFKVSFHKNTSIINKLYY